MYRVLACGVNTGPASKALEYAAKDAEDVARFFRGSLGPPVHPEHVALLTNGAATREAIMSAMLHALLDSPDFLTFYFSGHGARTGILAADGILPYERIISLLRTVRGPSTTIILDVCYAASFLDFIKEARIAGVGLPTDITLAWLDALARATPGTRLMFSTAADRLSGEHRDLQNGIFTHALVRALTRCKGDIDVAGASWVSDARAFAAARQIVRQVAPTQVPLSKNLTGDFPMSLSQAAEPVGAAYFVRTKVESHSLGVSFEVAERVHVRTKFTWRVMNAIGNEVASGGQTLEPSDSESNYEGRIPLPAANLRSDEITGLLLLAQNRARLEWHLALHDEHGHELDSHVVPVVYGT